MISFQNVTRQFDETVALSGIDLDLNGHKIVGLLGLNGAGKTTLLRILTGTLAPTAGIVRVGSPPTSPQEVNTKSQIGYLPEHCPLYVDMTVVDYLDYIAGLRGLHGDAKRGATDNVAKKLGLTPRLFQKIETLSKGFQQRVGLAQALIHNPTVVVLDEPTSGLDPKQMEDIRALIKDVAQNALVLLSTHNLHEVEQLCDEVVILVKGKVGASGPVSELIKGTPGLHAVFREVHERAEASPS